VADMKKFLIIFAIILILIIVFLFLSQEVVYSEPLKAKDSDGTISSQIIEDMKMKYEMVILKTYPFGYVEVEGWKGSGLLKKAFAIVEWKTYRDSGAGNIYIGYFFDGKNYTEVGPFNESEDFVKTVLEIPVNFFSDLNKLRVRFRGEDLDFAADAIAEVNIKLKVISVKLNFIT
jgi:hypothetical protein